MFFVSGITGQVGGAVAGHLLQDGHKVRALVRDPEKAAAWALKGVDIHQGDFNDVASVAKVLKDVEGAFVMLPPILSPEPGFPETQAIIASFREALHLAPPPRMVALSSIGAQQSSGLGLITTTHLMEEALRDLPMPTAFVRAGSFLENYTYGLAAAASSGWFDTFRTPTNRPVPMIATTDIGEQIAQLLVAGWDGRKIIELGSPRSPDELAQAMSEVLGKPVRARAISRERWKFVLEAQGMPSGSTGPFEEMEDSFNAGWIDFGVAGTESVAGKTMPAEVFTKAGKANG